MAAVEATPVARVCPTPPHQTHRAHDRDKSPEQAKREPEIADLRMNLESSHRTCTCLHSRCRDRIQLSHALLCHAESGLVWNAPDPNPHGLAEIRATVAPHLRSTAGDGEPLASICACVRTCISSPSIPSRIAACRRKYGTHEERHRLADSGIVDLAELGQSSPTRLRVPCMTVSAARQGGSPPRIASRRGRSLPVRWRRSIAVSADRIQRGKGEARSPATRSRTSTD